MKKGNENRRTQVVKDKRTKEERMKENEDSRMKGKGRKESLTFTIINIFTLLQEIAITNYSLVHITFMNRPQVETF